MLISLADPGVVDGACVATLCYGNDAPTPVDKLNAQVARRARGRRETAEIPSGVTEIAPRWRRGGAEGPQAWGFLLEGVWAGVGASNMLAMSLKVQRPKGRSVSKNLCLSVGTTPPSTSE